MVEPALIIALSEYYLALPEPAPAPWPKRPEPMSQTAQGGAQGQKPSLKVREESWLAGTSWFLYRTIQFGSIWTVGSMIA
jgi:hypothetical protein